MAYIACFLRDTIGIQAYKQINSSSTPVKSSSNGEIQKKCLFVEYIACFISWDDNCFYIFAEELTLDEPDPRIVFPSIEKMVSPFTLDSMEHLSGPETALVLDLMKIFHVLLRRLLDILSGQRQRIGKCCMRPRLEKFHSALNNVKGSTRKSHTYARFLE